MGVGSYMSAAPLRATAEAAQQRLRDMGINLGYDEALSYACTEHADPSTVSLLLDAGASHSAMVGPNRWTAMHYAAQSGAVGAMRVLRERGASIHAKDDAGETPFHVASTTGALEAMRLLQLWGARISERNASGETPFHIAALEGQLEGMAQLRVWGASIEEPNDSGMTPFHSVTEEGDALRMELLWRWGCDINACDHEGRSPLGTAREEGHPEAARMLVLWGAAPPVQGSGSDACRFAGLEDPTLPSGPEAIIAS